MDNYPVGYPLNGGAFDPLRGGEELVASIASATSQALHELGLGDEFSSPGAFNPTGSNPGALRLNTADNFGYAALGYPPTGYNPFSAGAGYGTNNYNGSNPLLAGTFSPRGAFCGLGYTGAPQQSGPYPSAPFPPTNYYPAQYSPVGYGMNQYENTPYNAPSYHFGYPNYPTYTVPPYSMAQQPNRVFNAPVTPIIAEHNEPVMGGNYGVDPSGVRMHWPPGNGAQTTGSPGRNIFANQAYTQGQSLPNGNRHSCGCQPPAANICTPNPSANNARCQMSITPQGIYQKAQANRVSSGQTASKSNVCTCDVNTKPENATTGDTKKDRESAPKESVEANSANKGAKGCPETNSDPANPSAANPNTRDVPTMTADYLNQVEFPDQNIGVYRLVNVGSMPNRGSGGDSFPGAFAVPLTYNPVGASPALFNGAPFRRGPMNFAPMEPNPSAMNPMMLPPGALSGSGVLHPGSNVPAYTPLNVLPAGLVNNFGQPYNPQVFNASDPPGVFNVSGTNNPGKFACTAESSGIGNV